VKRLLPALALLASCAIATQPAPPTPASFAGRTWLPRQVIRAGKPPLGFGDPSLIVDRETGRLFLFYAASVNRGFARSASGIDENNPDLLQSDLSWSDDDGVTWQHRRITAAIKDSAWGGLFAASGQGIQLAHGPFAGRLIQQYVVRWRGGNYAASAISDDHGPTWRMGKLVGPGADENKTVELSDGRVMLNIRAKPYRLVAMSTDGGVSYSAPHPDATLIDPGNNGAIIQVDPDARVGTANRRRIAFSNTADTVERRNLTVRLSCDDGKSWSASRTIEAGPAAYSTMVAFPNGDIGVLYERGAYQQITFTRFTPRWPRGCG
jgi:sialidase-1